MAREGFVKKPVIWPIRLEDCVGERDAGGRDAEPHTGAELTHFAPYDRAAAATLYSAVLNRDILMYLIDVYRIVIFLRPLTARGGLDSIVTARANGKDLTASKSAKPRTAGWT